MIFISVIVPNFNHAQFLKQRIESVLLQTYPYFEVIILDDASTDNSIEIIEQFRPDKKISHIIYNQTNSGTAFGLWQQGISLANGQWIWIAESDDFAAPDFLMQAVEKIKTNESIGICYCDSNIFDEDLHQIVEKFSDQKNRLFATNKWSSNYFNTGINEINESLKYNCNINNVSAIVFKKNLALPMLSEIAGFKYYGDWFFCLRLLFVSDIFYIATPLNIYRRHPNSYLNSSTSLQTSRQEYFRILTLLYHDKRVNDKSEMLLSFTYNHLSFGLQKDGLKKGFSILKSYFIDDWKLAIKVVIKMFSIKLFNSHFKKKFDIIEKSRKN